MEELQRLIDAQANQLDREYEALTRLLDDGPSEETVALLLVQAKNVRRQSTLLVKRIAQMRDHLQPGGTR